MDEYTLGFIILIAFLLVVGIWQLITLKTLQKKSTWKENLNDAKYYELKYHVQMLTSIFPIILFILGLVGYKELKSLPDTIHDEVSLSIKPEIDNLSKELEILKKKHEDLISSYNNLASKEQNVRSGLSNSSLSLDMLKGQLDDVQQQASVIGQKDIVKQNIYVVNNLEFRYKKMTEPEIYDYVSYNFSNMITISGNRLPKFKKPPIILPINNTGDDYTICSVNSNGFKVWNSGGVSSFECKKESNPQSFRFNIVIFSQD